MIQLPVDFKIPAISEALKKHNNLVISAAPGAGKTSRIPPALLKITSKKILVLEPRRLSAIAASLRIAEENNWQIGNQVGYQVRFENKTQASTQLIFLTEALLSRKLLNDPDLQDVEIVILDEFHERSKHVDLALGLIRELQILSRPDLKIIVMSATIDTQKLSDYLGQAPVIEVPGKLFNLMTEGISSSQLMNTDHLFIERVSDVIKKHVSANPSGKDILVFLPGMSEIKRLQKLLESLPLFDNFLILPLSGTLDVSEQLVALQPQDKRKIILSTNVAESSVTIDGLDTVIDSGLARVSEIDNSTGFENLELRRISKASAKQRAGRAARQQPGKCIQLWNKMDELSMKEFDVAEVHRTDLCETMLLLKFMGIDNLNEFLWYEKPKVERIDTAIQFLNLLGALENNKITELGKKLINLPVHPRLAKLLLKAQQLDVAYLGAEICALLQDGNRNILQSGHHESSCDLCEQIDEKKTRTQQKMISQLMNILKSGKNTLPKEYFTLTKKLLLQAYPDRICKIRKKGEDSAIMVGRKGVRISQKSSALLSDFFIALEVKDGFVFKACGISKELIDELYSSSYQKERDFTFDESSKSYYFEETLTLWKMPLESPRRRPASVSEVTELLPEIMLQLWSEVQRKNEDLQRWLLRWKFYIQQKNLDYDFTPDLLKSIFQNACLGETKFDEVLNKNLIYYFELSIESSILIDFHKMCPEKLALPSGKYFPIHYHLDKNPHAEIKLQELFGVQKTPTVFLGKIPITLHLLGPNFRPVQVTSDLESFWKNTYSEVKKELKSRYPKHKWP